MSSIDSEDPDSGAEDVGPSAAELGSAEDDADELDSAEDEEHGESPPARRMRFFGGMEMERCWV
jgi:hypothetical protein